MESSVMDLSKYRFEMSMEDIEDARMYEHLHIKSFTK